VVLLSLALEGEVLIRRAVRPQAAGIAACFVALAPVEQAQFGHALVLGASRVDHPDAQALKNSRGA
jgi:hypothetical protein